MKTGLCVTVDSQMVIDLDELSQKMKLSRSQVVEKILNEKIYTGNMKIMSLGMDIADQINRCTEKNNHVLTDEQAEIMHETAASIRAAARPLRKDEVEQV